MHPKTKNALTKIKALEENIVKIKKAIKYLKDNCEHLDFKVFDVEPKKICVVCDSSFPLSNQDAVALAGEKPSVLQ